MYNFVQKNCIDVLIIGEYRVGAQRPLKKFKKNTPDEKNLVEAAGTYCTLGSAPIKSTLWF